MSSPKSEIRKEIADLINRIKEQSDRIGNQREIPQMELDLILHRIEELHRKTVVWSYLNEQPETASVQDAVGSMQSSQPVTSTPDLQEKLLKNDIQAEKFEAPANPEPVIEQTPVPAMETKLSDPDSRPGSDQAPPGDDKRKDIRSFIGFNEKLMYIRQVFGGNNAAYEEALNELNGMQTFSEAEAYLSVLAGEYKWNYESEPVAIFLRTVKRKFA